MSQQLDAQLANVGTRFLIFPQPRFLTKDDGTPVFPEPEEVIVSVPPAEMQPGPADDRMFVVDAVEKLPYNRLTRPPYRGPARPPVSPGPDGHFTHLDPDSREFSAATMYATVRRVLDIFEDYFGHHLEWHFDATFSRLELIPLIEWDNAQSGFGFLEFGYGRTPGGTIDHTRPYCQNFDVLAHELGHSIVFSEVGVPSSPLDEGIDYGGMQESSGDLTAIVALLHFDSFVKHLLGTTKGNLLTVNGLDRVGELSDSRQIRVAFNSRRMSDVGPEPHERSLPLTGAIFDTMVEVFQQELVQNGLITADLRDRSTQLPGSVTDLRQIQADFEAAYQGQEKEFERALLNARDYLGRLLAVTWGSLSPDFLTYHDVLRALVRADRTVSGGANQAIIRACFAWREIAPSPDSVLLHQHTLQDCGLRTAQPVEDATRTIFVNGAGADRPRQVSSGKRKRSS
ncbi:hypothetical protein GCM10023321_12980 [Pseudonocardia eucalypti]|uniref:Peptidase M4 family protein n=1 Tax=Pseudonocardia eucalypti TaxID=648755 RepID=A0ABP9PN48_9PSEU|nr:hypothetical protein [Pseudonocardia eucalypti]